MTITLCFLLGIGVTGAVLVGTVALVELARSFMGMVNAWLDEPSKKSQPVNEFDRMEEKQW
jgi:hypothetical protein